MKDNPWLRSLQRPTNYADLSAEQQWGIDKGLGILDWEGCTMDQGLRDLLDPYDHLPLECDGFTRVATYVLTMYGIPHKCYVGSCVSVSSNFEVCPHFWIEVGEFVVDYRLILYPYRDNQGMRWRFVGSRPTSELADQVMDFPNGVFRRTDYPDLKYCGEETELAVTELLFQILTAEELMDKERIVLENLRRVGL